MITDVKFRDTLPPPVYAYENWLRQQAQSLLSKGGLRAELPSMEVAELLFSNVDINTRSPIETPRESGSFAAFLRRFARVSGKETAEDL